MENSKRELEEQINHLRLLREETGWNRKQFAESLGIPLRTVEDWEAGKRKMPDYLMRLIAYKIKIEMLQGSIINKKGKTPSRNVNIVCDAEGKKLVLINDIRFKGKKKEEWDEIEKYLIEYVGSYYEVEESSDIIYIDSDFPDDYELYSHAPNRKEIGESIRC